MKSEMGEVGSAGEGEGEGDEVFSGEDEEENELSCVNSDGEDWLRSEFCEDKGGMAGCEMFDVDVRADVPH
jgi:hypothetical protein